MPGCANARLSKCDGSYMRWTAPKRRLSAWTGIYGRTWRTRWRHSRWVKWKDKLPIRWENYFYEQSVDFAKVTTFWQIGISTHSINTFLWLINWLEYFLLSSSFHICDAVGTFNTARVPLFGNLHTTDPLYQRMRSIGMDNVESNSTILPGYGFHFRYVNDWFLSSGAM